VNPGEHELTYPWPDVPAPGAVITLRPGVHWLRMRLPFALDHINLWLLDDEIDGVAGFTQIDCGISNEDTRANWEQLFATFFAGRPLLRVLSTHFHPDHFGLAYWLTAGGDGQRWRAPLWMSATEYAFGRFLSAGGDNTGPTSQEHFARNGLTDPDTLSALRARGAGHYPKLVPAVPPSFHRISDGDEIAIGRGGHKRIFKVIVGYGHAPEHVSLHCAEDHLLISGDMVLPRISTNVSVWPVEPDGDPLGDFLESLDQFSAFDAGTLVLPSHGRPFRGIQPRVAELKAHHAARLEVLARQNCCLRCSGVSSPIINCCSRWARRSRT